MSKPQIKHYSLAMVALLGLWGAAPGSVAVAAAPELASSLDAGHPSVMQQAASGVAGANTGPLAPFVLQPQLAAAHAGTLGREVFGFALASSLVDPTLGYSTWNFSLLSTVAYFGLHIKDDGGIAADSGWTVWNSSQLSGLLSTAHSHGTKVVVTIILQDFSPGTPHMCAGLANSSATIAATVAQVKAKGVDGVNLDYEGLNGSCATGDPSWARRAFTNLAAGFRAALPSGSYLSADTYASSAADPVGFFDIGGLAPSVDSFFVMAYDLEYSNYTHAPLGCRSFCLGPTAPLTGYYYNDTRAASEYVAAVPASKVILGVPYYGRKECVSSATPNQFPNPSTSVAADGYLDAVGEAGAPAVRAGTFATHRDANDPAGQERWDTWFNTTMNCTRELYWDDATSLGQKYNLVNQDDLRGVGIWTLNYGGGAPELWNELALKFTTTTSWVSLQGILISAPDVSSWGANRVDAFVRGTNNAVWQDTWNGARWVGWHALGGAVTSDPAAASWGANRIDLFERGADGSLLHRFSDGSNWSAWESLGGVLTSGPDVAAWSSNRLDAFVRGQDNALWHMYWSGTWSRWEQLGGILTSSPTAVSWGPGRLDVFVRGADNQLWHRTWSSNGWSPWSSLGGGIISGPDAASCAPGHLDVFAIGPDHALYQLGYNGRAWTQWQRLGGDWTSDPGAACMTGTGTIAVVARGSDNAAWQTTVAAS